jgi:plastocyanin
MPSHNNNDDRHGQTGHGAPAESEHATGQAGHGGAGPAAGGLAVSQDGYTFEPERTFFEPGESTRFSFAITDARGRTVRDEFEPEHERELHLIVVRRDTAIYEHVHPRKSEDGTWSVELTLSEPGVYRAYADFTIDGTGRTLATDLFVPGDFRPEALPDPARTDSDGGYDVELRADGAKAGSESALTFAVTREGQPAENLEDYLGAKGHLVALREGDLAYLHVHPIARGEQGASSAQGGAHDDGHDNEQGDDAMTDAHEVSFAATFPSAGRYRLFLQFKTNGEIRTVAYTREVPR